jgi:transposase-like protein
MCHETRRNYSREFKIAAVLMANEREVTPKQIGDELDTNPSLLGKWRKQKQKQKQKDCEPQAFPGQGSARDKEMDALNRFRGLVTKLAAPTPSQDDVSGLSISLLNSTFKHKQICCKKRPRIDEIMTTAMALMWLDRDGRA